MPSSLQVKVYASITHSLCGNRKVKKKKGRRRRKNATNNFITHCFRLSFYVFIHLNMRRDANRRVLLNFYYNVFACSFVPSFRSVLSSPSFALALFFLSIFICEHKYVCTSLLAALAVAAAHMQRRRKYSVVAPISTTTIRHRLLFHYRYFHRIADDRVGVGWQLNSTVDVNDFWFFFFMCLIKSSMALNIEATVGKNRQIVCEGNV